MSGFAAHLYKETCMGGRLVSMCLKIMIVNKRRGSPFDIQPNVLSPPQNEHL